MTDISQWREILGNKKPRRAILSICEKEILHAQETNTLGMEQRGDMVLVTFKRSVIGGLKQNQLIRLGNFKKYLSEPFWNELSHRFYPNNPVNSIIPNNGSATYPPPTPSKNNP